MSVVFLSVKVASKNNTTVEQELAPLAQRASECLDRLYPSGRLAEVRVIFFWTFKYSLKIDKKMNLKHESYMII